MNDETVFSARRPAAYCSPGITAGIAAASICSFSIDIEPQAERVWRYQGV
jgi:hypothetical protein